MSRSIARALPLVALIVMAGCADREASDAAPVSAASSSPDDVGAEDATPSGPLAEREQVGRARVVPARAGERARESARERAANESGRWSAHCLPESARRARYHSREGLSYRK